VSRRGISLTAGLVLGVVLIVCMLTVWSSRAKDAPPAAPGAAQAAPVLPPASAVDAPPLPAPSAVTSDSWMLIAGVPVPWPPSPESLIEGWPEEWRPYLVGIEVCDLGWVRPSPSQDGWLTPAQTEQSHRLLQTLARAHQNPKVRALNVFDPEADKLMPGLAHTQRAQLVASAVATTDPALYALALRACESSPASDRVGCEGLSHRRWAQLDPDNAVPWFYLAGEAQRDGDPNLWHEALYRASLATRSDTYADQLLLAVEQAVPAGVARWQRLHHQLLAIGFAAGQGFPPYSAALAFCEPGLLADANRRQLCERLAQRMTEQQRSLLELAIGTALGRHVGWPRERLQALRAETYVLPKVSMERSLQLLLQSDCQSMQAFGEQLAQRAREGELRWMRSVLQEQGLTPLQWLAANPESQARFDKEFATLLEARPRPARPSASAPG